MEVIVTCRSADPNRGLDMTDLENGGIPLVGAFANWCQQQDVAPRDEGGLDRLRPGIEMTMV